MAAAGSRTSKPKSGPSVTKSTARSSTSPSTRTLKATSTSSLTLSPVVKKLCRVLTVAASTTAQSWPPTSSTRFTTHSGALPPAGSRYYHSDLDMVCCLCSDRSVWRVRLASFFLFLGSIEEGLHSGTIPHLVYRSLPLPEVPTSSKAGYGDQILKRSTTTKSKDELLTLSVSGRGLLKIH